jgi:hypothetical protein
VVLFEYIYINYVVESALSKRLASVAVSQVSDLFSRHHISCGSPLT